MAKPKPTPKALKVFKTAAGFQDAYIATATKKAALEAWGSTHNLFALGQAEEVIDPALCKAPLAHPGEVIRVSRGTVAQQLAALPPNAARPRAPEDAQPTAPELKRRFALPRPDRGSLEAAEQSYSNAERAHTQQRRRITDEMAQLKSGLAGLDGAWTAQAEALRAALETERATYEAALSRWQADRG